MSCFKILAKMTACDDHTGIPPLSLKAWCGPRKENNI